MSKTLVFIRKMANNTSLNFISALLLEAQSTPFQITPSTMANIVKGLYTLRPGKKENCLSILLFIYVSLKMQLLII